MQRIFIILSFFVLTGFACSQNMTWEALNGDQMGMDKPCDVGVLEHTVCFPVVYRMEGGKWKAMTEGEITSSPGILGQGGVGVGYYGSNIGGGSGGDGGAGGAGGPGGMGGMGGAGGGPGCMGNCPD